MGDIANPVFHGLLGIPWRMLSPCFPPNYSVHGRLAAWRDTGL